MKLVIGVDSSTQSTKAELRDLATGELIAVGRAAHPPTTPPVSEQDPAAWWRALAVAIEQLGDQRKHAVALSIGGQQHGLVLVDEAGDVVRPAKLWNDTTSAPQADRLVEELGASWWAQTAGVVPVAAFTISKLAWVAENEPDSLARAARVMLPHDWLTFVMTGAHVTDRGDASGSGWFDATTGSTLVEPLVAACGADWTDRVPRVLAADQAAGQILPTVATALGLSHDLVVAAGTGDNMAAALGLGLQTGDVVVSLGTSGTAYTRAEARTSDTTGAVAGFCDATGGYLPLVCTLNATKVTDTVAAWQGTDAAGLSVLALDAGVDDLEAVLVPYFDGERTPNRPDARGEFSGLSTTTTREQLARAAHDGVICGLLDGVDALRESGAGADGRIVLVGGGARSEAYRQRLAEIAGQTVHVPLNEESVAVGAAVQASVVASEQSFDDVATTWHLRATTQTEPRPNAAAQSIRERYAAARG